MRGFSNNSRSLVGLATIFGLALFIVVLALLVHGIANAGEPQTTASMAEGSAPQTVISRLHQSQGEEPVHPPPDQACRLCHSDTEREITFPSGETLAVAVDLEGLSRSAHGDQAATPLACTDCHMANEFQIPHEPVTAEDLRSYEIARAATCEQCHVQPHITSHPGPESENPVICTDCHGAHNTLTAVEWQTGQGTETCVNCHVESGVPITDPVMLSQIIRDGMFAEKANSDYCLGCHGQEGLSFTFPNGDQISLTVNANDLHSSVHGAENRWGQLECADCHGKKTYPHEPVLVTSAREYQLASNQRCERCHERHFEKALDSVHGAALQSGNLEAAMCTDCHGAHDTPIPDVPRERISYTCRKCHSTIFDAYAESVHGAALLEESNPDVATCIDCHGVHDISDPTTNLARARSPELCATCHADEELMAKYGISTDVFETYLDDFHGTTASLLDPDAVVLTAVCYDCHGVHDIRPVDDPETGIKANLLVACQQCHPDANENFPDAWTSHYQPSPTNNTLVWLVDTFYAFVIPVTVGGLGFLVATDIFRRVRTRLFRR